MRETTRIAVSEYERMQVALERMNRGLTWIALNETGTCRRVAVEALGYDPLKEER